mmetsp:Transcript_34853/g.67782  ORF Transcript_34853/g.67782 Transcript_34853/m.67782 type:complete len:248 (-) Transcript_34853:1480-2223(-)
MTRDESRDRDQKQRIVWAPRGQILWPAEVQETVSGAAVCFKYLGPKKERAVAADPSSAVSFIPNLDRLSNQSSDPGFVQALMEGCRLSHIGDKLPTGWHEQKDETSSQETPSLYSDKNSASSEEIDDDGPVALGTRIRIREAQAIHPKLHAYENTEAVVVRLPVLPSTWYCVRLHDDEIVKIRRTAFQVLPDRRRYRNSTFKTEYTDITFRVTCSDTVIRILQRTSVPSRKCGVAGRSPQGSAGVET